ncbi:NUDIX domain-containing protein [Limnoglobus roseus]|uniref:NUDIX hydrolase n=1 Tax=Limnoglobus roseus TaxID=2598579 RepID=A0A5C1AAA3_9BACT|nr:NUDIX hydrolase [Limnoglobus roseus]QEL15660.1 NUDIX hydrolase [Limnoglobus roseus]
MGKKSPQKYSYDYPRPALTVDVVLVSREGRPKILLIQRAGDPFAGLWALPGGFVNENERLIDAANRELEEETGLRINDLEQLYTAGDPGRDPRGWTVSVVYLARVDPEQLKVKAGDDAADAKWFPLDKLPRLAFDHAMILDRAKTRLADRRG